MEWHNFDPGIVAAFFLGSDVAVFLRELPRVEGMIDRKFLFVLFSGESSIAVGSLLNPRPLLLSPPLPHPTPIPAFLDFPQIQECVLRIRSLDMMITGWIRRPVPDFMYSRILSMSSDFFPFGDQSPTSAVLM